MIDRAHLIVLFVLVSVFAMPALAQNADNATEITATAKEGRKDLPKDIREQLDKLRIEQNKKDYKKMLDRGDEVLKISADLEKRNVSSAEMASSDADKIVALEKLVKKIRSSLGGKEDDIDDDADQPQRDGQQFTEAPKDHVSGIKALHEAAANLVDELKKTTRFSISASAIYAANAVLRLTRSLRSQR